jgi:hypothetical protein
LESEVELSNEMFLIVVVVAASILLYSSTDVVVARQFRFHRRVGGRAGGEDREAVDQVLSGREPFVSFPPPAAAPETTGDASFAHTGHLLTIRES